MAAELGSPNAPEPGNCVLQWGKWGITSICVSISNFQGVGNAWWQQLKKEQLAKINAKVEKKKLKRRKKQQRYHVNRGKTRADHPNASC
jgi:hypothetical protein